MISRRRLSIPVFSTLLFAIALIVLLQPWRNVVGQDDASYALFSDHIRNGIWKAPGLLLAAAWPQALIGAAFGSLLNFIPALSSYMLVTFIFFVFNFSAFVAVFQTTREDFVPALWVSSFFLFPVTLQYGLAYLTETFVLTFLICYFSLLAKLLKQQTVINAIGIVVLSVLIGLQRQTYLIFPFGSLLLILLNEPSVRRWRVAAPVALGLLAALVAYAFTPKTFLQDAFIDEMFVRWRDYAKPAGFIAAMLNRVAQLLLAVGLFATPLAFVKRWQFTSFASVVLLQLTVIALVFLSPFDPITAGVLFTGYLPRLIGIGFVSAGVWGLAVLTDYFSELRTSEKLVIAVSTALFLGFTAFLDASDVKYVLPAALAILYVLFQFKRSSVAVAMLRQRHALFVGYLISLVCVSVVANRYYLDTLDERFKLARSFENQGFIPELISAGYGRDSYVMGESCLQLAKKKIQAMSLEVQAAQVREHLVINSPRQYEDQARFKYVIKPYEIFGKKMSLSKNRLDGQASQPSSIHRYSVFGIPNSLAVFENANPVRSWCFQ